MGLMRITAKLCAEGVTSTESNARSAKSALSITHHPSILHTPFTPPFYHASPPPTFTFIIRVLRLQSCQLFVTHYHTIASPPSSHFSPTSGILHRHHYTQSPVTSPSSEQSPGASSSVALPSGLGHLSGQGNHCDGEDDFGIGNPVKDEVTGDSTDQRAHGPSDQKSGRPAAHLAPDRHALILWSRGRRNTAEIFRRNAPLGRVHRARIIVQQRPQPAFGFRESNPCAGHNPPLGRARSCRRRNSGFRDGR